MDFNLLRQILIKMSKRTFQAMIINCLMISVIYASGLNAQEIKSVKDASIKLNIQNADLMHVFKDIEAKTDYEFSYENKDMDREFRFSGKFNNVSVADVLLEISKQTGLRFKQVNNNIHITKKDKKANREAPLEIIIQGITVTGKINSAEDSEGLPGVNVIIKGTSQGTVTDLKGYYKLDVPSEESVLVFSSVGFTTEEVAVGTKTVIDMVLVPDLTALEEIVVIGYGVKKKIHNTGAISTVKSDDLANAPVSNLNDAIVGLASGVIAVTPGGKPGTGAQIQIRGMGTLQNNAALVVVDGIIRPYSQLDPNEIESINILKDGASAAIYGVKGGNGVILVTTKRGASGKPKFSYNGYTGIQQVTRYPDLLNSYQYADVNNQAYLNMGIDPNDPAHAGKFYTDQQMQEFKSGEIDTDFYDLVFKDNPIKTQHNMNINGGSENVKYFFSTGYLSQDGLIPNSSFKRYNLRSNVDAMITDNLKILVDIDGRIENDNTPSYGDGTVFAHMIRAAPVLRAYDVNGKPLKINGPNALEESKNGGLQERRTSVINARFKAVQKLNFIEGLSANFSYAYNESNTLVKKFRKPYLVYIPDENGMATNVTEYSGGATSLNEDYINYKGYTLNGGLNYDRTFGKHKINALAIYEQREYDSKNLNAFREGYISDIIQEIFAGDPEKMNNNGYSSEIGYMSYIGRISYVYNDKYLAEVSARNDASVLFPEDTRWGFFPSYSVGWRISEEGFLKDNVDFIDNLKLRASYANLGTDAGAGQYAYLEQYSLGFGALMDNQITPGLKKKVEPNKTITWEKVASFDIGLEATFWNGLLGFDVAYFKKNTSDILARKTISTPATFGAEIPPSNYAEVELKGFEMSLSHINRIGKLQYSIDANFTHSVNNVIRIDDPENQLPHLIREGKPLDFYVGLKTDGLFQTDEEAQNYYPQFGNTQVGAGDIKYVDRNGDKIIDENDLDVISLESYMPQIMYGLNFTLNWKNFDMRALLQGASKRKIMLSGAARTMYQIGGNNFFAYQLDAWSQDNTGAEYPRAWRGNNINNDRDSDYWLRDGSYVRLKSAEIGYSINNAFLKKLNIEKLRLFVTGYNIFTIDKLKIFDPEVGSGSGQYNVNANAQNNYTTGGGYYPQLKNFNIGLNLTF